MGLLDSFGNTLQNLGSNVGNKLDDLAGSVVQKTGLKKELGGLFAQVNNAEQGKEVTFEPLQLPELYENGVKVLLKNEKRFANVNNIAGFLQALVDTGAHRFFSAIDPNVPVDLTGSRQNDLAIVLSISNSISDLLRKYTPHSDFEEQYKISLTPAGESTITVRQPDGSYVLLAQNTQPIPVDMSFSNIVPGIKDHMEGLSGGYTVVYNDVPVVAPAPIDAAKIAQELVNNPAGTPVSDTQAVNPNQTQLPA